MNQDGGSNIADPVAILTNLFGSSVIPCMEAAEVNGDGAIDIADPVYLLGYIFNSGPTPPAPFPDCGITVAQFPCDNGNCP